VRGAGLASLSREDIHAALRRSPASASEAFFASNSAVDLPSREQALRVRVVAGAIEGSLV